MDTTAVQAYISNNECEIHVTGSKAQYIANLVVRDTVMKIINVRKDGIGKCPVCLESLIADDKDLHFCPTCGQRLKS